MSKFGVFNISGGNVPLKTIEGDYMEQEREFVKVFQKKAHSERDEQVGAFHLDKGQLVKKISD